MKSSEFDDSKPALDALFEPLHRNNAEHGGSVDPLGLVRRLDRVVQVLVEERHSQTERESNERTQQSVAQRLGSDLLYLHDGRLHDHTRTGLELLVDPQLLELLGKRRVRPRGDVEFRSQLVGLAALLDPPAKS